MAAQMEKTRHAGIWKRAGATSSRTAQRQAEVGLRSDARRGAQGQGRHDHRRGSGRVLRAVGAKPPRVRREWIDRYQGTGRRGFREETRAEYHALLEKYALAYFDDATRLTEITPRAVADFIGWLVRQPNRSGRNLSDSSVRKRSQAAVSVSGDREARGADPQQPGRRREVATSPARGRPGGGSAPPLARAALCVP